MVEDLLAHAVDVVVELLLGVAGVGNVEVSGEEVVGVSLGAGLHDGGESGVARGEEKSEDNSGFLTELEPVLLLVGGDLDVDVSIDLLSVEEEVDTDLVGNLLGVLEDLGVLDDLGEVSLDVTAVFESGDDVVDTFAHLLESGENTVEVLLFEIGGGSLEVLGGVNGINDAVLDVVESSLLEKSPNDSLESLGDAGLVGKRKLSIIMFLVVMVIVMMVFIVVVVVSDGVRGGNSEEHNKGKCSGFHFSLDLNFAKIFGIYASTNPILIHW